MFLVIKIADKLRNNLIKTSQFGAILVIFGISYLSVYIFIIFNNFDSFVEPSL
jgi:hypothetical protein